MRSKLLAIISSFLMLIGVMLPILAFSPAAMAEDWTQVNIDGFGEAMEKANSMAVYNSKLYVGTCSEWGGQVWEYNGRTWSRVKDGFGEGGVWSMAVCNSKLYVGTSVVNIGPLPGTSAWDGAAEVWEYDGSTWTQVNTKGFGDNENYGALSMVVLGSKLYVGTGNGNTGCEVWRYDGPNPGDWTQVNTDGFEPGVVPPQNDEARSMTVYNAKLYVGTNNIFNGCEVWRYDGPNPGDWTQVNDDGFGKGSNYAVACTSVYNSELFAGTEGNCEVWSFNGNTWSQANTDSFGDIGNRAAWSMVVYDSKLNVGTDNPENGCEVWSYDGNTWSQASNKGFGDGDNRTALSMAVFDSKVHVGTYNWNGCQVWGNFKEAPASTFYFAEGSCRPGFDPYLCIQNPGATAANVTITYMLGDGTTETEDVTVNANSRSTVVVKDTLGEGNDDAHDFSSRVECTNGQEIIVERPMYFNYNGVWNGGHDVVGALAPASTFYFAEGSCRPGFDPYLCIQNPGATAANVTITYMKGDGTTETQDVTVGANSRSTVVVKDTLGEGNDDAHDFSSRVECTNDQQIIVERPMYFNYNGVWNGGHDVIGALAPASTFYFAEGSCRPGFDPYLCIQNPGATAAEVTITYMLGDGTTETEDVTVNPNSRSTVVVKDTLGEGNDDAHDFSSRVECTNGQQIIVERPMYFNYNNAWPGGHDVIGALAPASTFYFAEGSCRPGFDPYLCIQNPGTTAANVTITYMKGDGTTETEDVTVNPNSRSTVVVKDTLGEGNDDAHDFSSRVECTNDQQIIVERPMYFNYNGVWNGGHDVVGL